MYHFVRDLKKTRYPMIKARRLSEFKKQLDYLEENYELVTVERCVEAIHGKNEIPKDAVLLTFDDGYKDHYENVFPILEKRGIQGCFFPPAKAILKNEVLDVNKIHFILAVNEEKDNIDGLLDDIVNLLNRHRKEYGLKSYEKYYTDLAIEGAYDPEEIIFIKRLLQRELPEAARNKMVDSLFKKYVDVDEKVLSNELYMDIEQLQCMQRNGMHIGSHGYDHHWLNSISREKLDQEIEGSIEFLNKIDVSKDVWTFCYPYGAYNEEICEAIKKKGFKLGFSTDPEVAVLDERSAMKLPRIDTNEIPY